MTTKPTIKVDLEGQIGRRSREVQILAKSIYRDMMAQGFAMTDVVSLATELLDQVTSRMDTGT